MKFFGDENAASVPDTDGYGQHDAQRSARSASSISRSASRAAVVAAGPIANFILAIVIFAGIFAIYGKPSTAARVDTVQENSAAAAAGFQPGDVVIVHRRARDRKLLGDAARLSRPARASSSGRQVDRGGSR